MAARSDKSGIRILVCDCEGSNELNRSAMESAIGRSLDFCGTQLCRRQLPELEARLKDPQPLLIGCTQEAPLFLETAGDAQFEDDIRFVNIREKAGWSKAAGRAGAKMGALIAEAMLDVDGPGTVTMTSAGAVAIIGRDDVAVDAATRLGRRMDATLLLVGATEVSPPRTNEIPVFRAKAVKASGHLGAFDLEIEDFAAMTPSARPFLSFERAAPGRTRTECDIILDLTGATPLFSAADKRDGYFHPDPRNPAAVANALFDIADLIGEFEKPRYVEYDAAICAHSRNDIVGCSLCLDNCPAGAIQSTGDTVTIDPFLCAGCGNCASVCPTGAVRYTMPESDVLLQRLRILLTAYRQGGGDHPVLLFHDAEFGEDVIAAMARHYDGLPANVLPVAVNAVGQCGLDTFMGARAFGAEKCFVLVSPAAEPEIATLASAAELSNHIVSALGYEDGRVELLHETDPEAISARLWAAAKLTGDPARPKLFVPIGGKRALMSLGLAALHEAAPTPVDMIELPDGAPFGTVDVDVAGCTLCLACAGVCPANALRDSPEHPRLSFVENACVQCGLCVKTCPESVISLTPRLDFTRAARNPRVIKEEEPFECLRCGTPFATKSMIDKVVAAMASHSMFADEQALRRLKMCADCRVIDMSESQSDPFYAGLRPAPRTTDDYLSGAITDDTDDGSKD